MTRLFDLDPQLLHDSILLAISVFFLFLIMSYNLFEPARKLLNERKQKIKQDVEDAEKDKEDAAAVKAEYEKKLKEADKEVEAILAEARKKALDNEAAIIAEAKEEASRITSRAREEAALEQKRVADEMKQQMISVAAAMAQKVVSAQIDTNVQNTLVEETLREMGETTWQS